MGKFKYFQTSLLKNFQGIGFECPACGSNKSTIVDRKWVVTSLRRCAGCQLLFRAPTTTEGENARIYQTEYTQGFTTELPEATELARLLASSFAGTEKDYGRYLDVLRALGGKPGHQIFDFGCSWGYGSYQMEKAGYDVTAYEISASRAAYAHEKLSVKLAEPSEQADESCDIFFSAHVIEHVPSVAQMITLGLRLLRPGGLFVAFTPNGNTAFRQANPTGWSKSWGAVHPQLIDILYLEQLAQLNSVVADSNPFALAELARWQPTQPGLQLLNPVGGELLFALRK